jgi:ligand-binding SRPBCC domain-containing protein
MQRAVRRFQPPPVLCQQVSTLGQQLLMARIRLQTAIAAPVELVFDLARDIDFHQRSMAETGERAVAGRTSGLIELGETVTWRASQFGLTWSLTSRVTEFDRPVRFVDEQAGGPFAWFRHEHQFESAEGGTLMIDEWEHQLPFGLVGRVVDWLVVGRRMRSLLRRRNRFLAREAEVASLLPAAPTFPSGAGG